MLTKVKLAIHLGHCPPEYLDLKPYLKVFPELAIVKNIIHRAHKAILPDALQELAVDFAHQGRGTLEGLVYSTTIYEYPEIHRRNGAEN